MAHENLRSGSEAEKRKLNNLSLEPLRRKEQVVINRRIGVRICRSKGPIASILIACPNDTPIYSPGLEDKPAKPSSKDRSHTFFPIQLANGQKVKIENLTIEASKSLEGTTINIESYEKINTYKVNKDLDLRKVLSNLSSGDKRPPQ